MLTPGRILRRARDVLLSERREQDIDDELRFHIEMETAAKVRSGVSEAEAKTRAIRSFGGVDYYKSEVRESRGVRMLDELKSDIRFGLRTLARRPSVTAVAILTIAVGIGPTTAIFGAVHGILLASLPYRDIDRIALLEQYDTGGDGTEDDAAAGNFLDWSAKARAFERMAAAEPYSFDYIGPDGPIRMRNSRVTSRFFDVFGTKAAIGRTFLPEEFTDGRDRVVVLSHRLWTTQFRADSSVVGQKLILDSLQRTVVGVMPRGFEMPDEAEVWSPKIFREEEIEERKAAYYKVFGRLGPDASMGGAQREMSSVAAQLARDHPLTNAQTRVRVISLSDKLFGRARTALYTLLGAVACVLLIACANVANLQLSSAAEREREFAIRVAVGAGPRRLIRQLLTESLLLALGGAAVGLLLAYAGLWLITTLAPANLPRIDELSLSAPVLAFAFALTMIASVLFGLAPIANATRMNVQSVLAAGSGTRGATAGGTRRRLGGILVMAEVALALVLIVSAGLLGRSFLTLVSVDPGFQTRGITVVTLQAWGYYPTPGSRAQFIADATRRLAAIPGVAHVGMTSSLPLADRIGAEASDVTVAGAGDVLSRGATAVRVAAVAADYFKALDIPLRRGRTFETRDDSANAPVALVNAALARKYWGSKSPVGQSIRFRFMGPPREREIVGVVADVRHSGPHTEPDPEVYVPHAQAPTGAVHLVVASTASTPELRAQLKRELTKMNPAMPLTDIVTLESLLDDSLRDRRFQLTLLAIFALVALLLASVGIYGVISAVTAQRTHEIGIRMALGAKSRDVIAMVMREGIFMAAIGTVAGLIAAAAATQLLAGMLFNVGTLDPAVFIGGLASLLVITTLACWVPAARASRVDPASAIRET